MLLIFYCGPAHRIDKLIFFDIYVVDLVKLKGSDNGKLIFYNIIAIQPAPKIFNLL
jgi:hypothetical protein